MKTATITWISFYNYGSCLQAYALQHYIESLGCENRIIDDSSIVFAGVKPDKSLVVESKWKRRWWKVWQSVHANYRTFYRCQRYLCQGVDEFKANTLKIDRDTASVQKDGTDYDVYICGSDQIWTPSGFESPRWTFYYAAFTNKKKISYAPSIGGYQIPQKWKEKVAGLINSFSAISVREEAGQKALQELTILPVELVADPTLLLSRQEWESFLPAKKKNEDYVLGYILTPNDNHYRIARDYAHQHKMKFYLFMLNLQDYGQADKYISGGPFDFLEYIRNANVVFTDSFHGTIFSVIFETPFYTFKRFSDNSPINQNSRIETLFKRMGTETRLIDKHQNEPLNDCTLDFSNIKCQLEPLIEHSKKYLCLNLEAIKKETKSKYNVKNVVSVK